MSDEREARENDRTLLSTAGEKGLPSVLAADRENVLVLIGWLVGGAQIFFEPVLETLDAHTKELLTESLTKAADFVAASVTSDVYLPQCQHISATAGARMRGSFRRWIYRKRHILEKATDVLRGEGWLVGVRAIEQNAKMEVIFEERLLESLLNANGKARLQEALRRAAYVLEVRSSRSFNSQVGA